MPARLTSSRPAGRSLVAPVYDFSPVKAGQLGKTVVDIQIGVLIAVKNADGNRQRVHKLAQHLLRFLQRFLKVGVSVLAVFFAVIDGSIHGRL